MNENNKLLTKVFAWFRASGVTRGDDRWIGGVCSGIAARLGWSPTLVRALMIVFTFLFGFGAALYAFAWLMLPDARDGRILAEELVAGRWDWNCLGAFAMLAVAVVIVGAGWVAIVVAAVALWAICQSGMRQQHGYGYGYRKEGPNGPYTPVPPRGYPAGAAGGAYPGGAGGYPAAPGHPGGFGYPVAPAAGPVPGAATGPVPSQGAPNASFPVNAGGPAPTGPGRPVNPAGADGPVPPAGSYAAPIPGPSYVPPAGAAPVMPGPAPAPKPRRVRRKPAGPFLVLLVMGLSLVSGAAVMLAMEHGYADDHTGESIINAVTMMTVWISAVCIAMGVLLVILGAVGRRSGGLIPLALIAGFVACCMIVATGVAGYSTYDINNVRNGYTEVRLGAGSSAGSENAYGMVAVQARLDENADHDYWSATDGLNANMNYWVADSSPQNFRRLEQGVHFQGVDYDLSTANIDLSEYGNWNYGGEQVNKYKAGCPAGQINLSVRNAHVYVTLPDGCPYAFGSGGFVYMQTDSMGGYSEIVRNNGATTLEVPFLERMARTRDNHDDSMMNSDGYQPDNYDWQGNGETDESSFLINFTSGVSGKVTVRYASETVLPGYADFIRQISKGDVASLDLTTRKHYAVQNGDTTASGDNGSGAAGKKEHSDD
ncbi:PspC domain-containing protein [Bifidobacterium platyrrhinorum]|uniref:PspC domain-containing protein n=1 Tax=Bifidobacterium platyrrhinorum TaxID=2661628 RepID=A0A6L9SV84_9BIFI|nr:PspC domain-containing protein [Bifidobacterium platyrrhinorum]NEG55975.1 PspC domain-containing protein [Bifidobacterium platyrrhinorum]